MINLKILKNINQIIERDSKDTTYKFALLRGVIESVQEFAHLRKEEEDRIIMPLGLLIYRWLEYYYPIIGSPYFIPQKNGEAQGKSLAFRSKFKSLTESYSMKGRMSAFFNDLKKGKLESDVSQLVFELAKKLRETITKMPMKYIGYSVYGDYYKIFQYESSLVRSPKNLDLSYLIDNFGYYSFPKDYYTVFEYLGSYLTGKNAILLAWADFTVKCDKQRTLTTEKVLQEIMQTPVDIREVRGAQQFFLQEKWQGNLECIWSGKVINDDLSIDHVLPFAIWKNNDLWNLLPAKAEINNKKRDKIPSESLLNKRKDCILHYWEEIKKTYSEAFEKEVRIGLLGENLFDTHKWQLQVFDALKSKCDYLINTRGFEPWYI